MNSVGDDKTWVHQRKGRDEFRQYSTGSQTVDIRASFSWKLPFPRRTPAEAPFQLIQGDVILGVISASAFVVVWEKIACCTCERC